MITRRMNGATMSTILPPVPMNVPVVTETSYSSHDGPGPHGIDPRAQWWCEATRQPRSNDTIARVTPPGAAPYSELLCLTLPSDDLDDAETVGRFAVNVTRALVQLVNDADDQEAFDEVKALLSSAGPMGDFSGPSWKRIMDWLPGARAGRTDKVEITGNGWPQAWPLTEVAAFLGYKGPSARGSARKQLSRWGIEAIGRLPGRGGESLYAVDQVRAADADRPGRGHRTDLDTTDA